MIKLVYKPSLATVSFKAQSTPKKCQKMRLLLVLAVAVAVLSASVQASPIPTDPIAPAALVKRVADDGVANGGAAPQKGGGGGCPCN